MKSNSSVRAQYRWKDQDGVKHTEKVSAQVSIDRDGLTLAEMRRLQAHLVERVTQALKGSPLSDFDIFDVRVTR